MSIEKVLGLVSVPAGERVSLPPTGQRRRVRSLGGAGHANPGSKELAPKQVFGRNGVVEMKKSRIFMGLAILTALAVAGCSVPGGGGGGGAGGGGTGPAVVNLRTAGTFVMLSKAGITTTGVTAVTGDVGVSPVTAAAMTGFTLVMDVSNQFATSALITGKVYAANYAVPTPSKMTTAIADFSTAYTDAATRTPAVGSKLNMGAGTISGVTLTPGLYTWGTNLNITTDITISGGANDTWLFQVAGALSLSNNANIILSGGAKAKNIVWVVKGSGVSLGTSSHFEGIILSNTAITFTNGASMNGRAFGKTAVSMDTTTVVKP